MKGLLEKIKSLDKKILIGAGAGIVALIVAIVVILVVCLGGKDKDTYKEDDKTKVEQNDDKDKDEATEEESDDKEEATFAVKVVDGDGTAVAGVVVQVCKDECVPATTDETGVATFKLEITEGYKLSVVSCPEGYEYTGEEIALTAGITEYELKIQKKAESADGGNGGQTATQPPTTTKQDGTELFGNGSKDNPIEEWPEVTGNNTSTLTTISIPAGKTVYYEIYNAGNRILTINDANAYVIESNGTKHNARGGKVSFTVEDAKASDSVLVQIGNNSSSAKSFTIIFSTPTGSWDNKTVASMNTNITINLSANDSDGHWYKYIAERTGTIRFYLLTSPENNDLTVTNNRNSAQRTIADNGEIDSQGTYVELEVQQGDEIVINAAARPNNRGKYPATSITWCGKYN